MLLKRCRPWVKQVQSTDALDQLFGVEDSICRAVVHGSPLLIRQSDLSNCFTRLGASLASQLDKDFGRHARHSDLLFGLNELCPAVVRTGPAAGDWQVPSRGLAQGDPLSPLGAALYAAAHTAVLAAEVHGLSFQTFVDDRTTIAHNVADLVRARDLVQQLNELRGQIEDDKNKNSPVSTAMRPSCPFLTPARTI